MADCRHCKLRRSKRGTPGLCWGCAYHPDIRAQYVGVPLPVPPPKPPRIPRPPKPHRTNQQARNDEAKVLLAREKSIDAVARRKCAHDELPCVGCRRPVYVNEFQRTMAARFGCPWGMCETCRDAIGGGLIDDS